MIILRILSYQLAVFAYLYISGNIMIRAEDAEIKNDRSAKIKCLFFMFTISFGFIILATLELARLGIGKW